VQVGRDEVEEVWKKYPISKEKKNIEHSTLNIQHRIKKNLFRTFRAFRMLKEVGTHRG
jgi:hypothetical protein